MISEDKVTQSKVGIFLLIGLIAIGLVVVYFGRLGEGVRKYYTLRVEFPNASGLMRGSEVFLAGAKIGRVTEGPIILPEMNGVYVTVRIFEDVNIPKGSEFSIGSSGLLGDKYIQIRLKKNASKLPPIEPGATIKGVTESGGISGMTEQAAELIPRLRDAVDNINSVVSKIDNDVLSENGIQAINQTLKNLETTSASLAEASAKVDKVVGNADTAITSGKATMDSAQKAADELQRAVKDIRLLVQEIRQGKGVLGTLIGSREMAENLRALILNLRRHGVLWYRDTEREKSPAPQR